MPLFLNVTIGHTGTHYTGHFQTVLPDREINFKACT